MSSLPLMKRARIDASLTGACTAMIFNLAPAFSVVPQIDIKVLNTAVAKCSYEYFVSSESSPEKVELAASIAICLPFFKDFVGVIAGGSENAQRSGRD